MTTAIVASRKAEFEEVDSRIFNALHNASADLRHMRDTKLYAEGGFASWADYCQDRLGCSRQTGDRIIQHESLLENIATVAPKQLRLTHRAGEEIADLSPEQQREVIQNLPAGVSKPKPSHLKTARAERGIPAKPRKKRKVLEPSAHILSEPAPSKAGIVRTLFDKREESHRMPQDAFPSRTAPESNGRYETPTVGQGSDPATGEWLQRFEELMRHFAALFSRNAAFTLSKESRLIVSQGLRAMSEAIPVGVEWPCESGPTPDSLRSAVLLVQRVTLAAAEWGDTAAVGKLADEMRKSIGKLEPEAGDSDKELVEITETMQAVVDRWNASGLPKCQKLSPTRRRRLRDRLKDKFWRDNWAAAIDKAEQSSFCHGEKGWKATFDWFLEAESVLKLIEGKYDGSSKSPSRKLEADYGKGGRLR